MSRYFEEDGFSYRTMQSKAKGFTVDVESLRRQLWDWVQAQRKEELFDIPRCLLASVDFTFTGHRTERISSFASLGGSQPMSSASISAYTNCIITVVWADGINRTPPIAVYHKFCTQFWQYKIRINYLQLTHFCVIS